jgi:hypothetical protein
VIENGDEVAGVEETTNLPLEIRGLDALSRGGAAPADDRVAA